MDDDQILDTGLLVQILEEKFPGADLPDQNNIQCIQKFTNFRKKMVLLYLFKFNELG